MSTIIPRQLCPVCNKEFDRATCMNREGDAPEPGDITLCFGCGSVLRFGPECRTHERVTDAEFAALDADMQAEVRSWQIRLAMETRP